MPRYSVFEYDEVKYALTDNKEKIEDNTLYLKENSLSYLENLEEKKIAIIYRNKIKFQNYIGVISFDNITIEILPKFLKNNLDANSIDIETRRNIYFNLIRMLEYSKWWEMSIKEIELAEFKEKDLSDFFEIFIYLFAKNLVDLLKKTRDYSYIRKFDELKFVKGKFDFRKYWNPARYHIIPCIYHERSINTIINRLLKYTSYILLKKSKVSKNIKYLKEVCSLLDPVPVSSVSLGEVKNLTYNCLNLCFKPYVEICKTFLKNAVITFREGGEENYIKFFSFLIPMEKLFEKFISEAFNEIIEELNKKSGNKYEISIQEPCGYLLRNNNKYLFELIPDIVIKKTKKENGLKKELIIIDTKYKLLKEDSKEEGTELEENLIKKVSQQDLYQIYAYCKEIRYDFADKDSINVKSVLLYPQEINSDREINEFYKLGKEGIDLRIRSISLNNIFEEDTLKLNETFKETLRDIIEN